MLRWDVRHSFTGRPRSQSSPDRRSGPTSSRLATSPSSAARVLEFAAGVHYHRLIVHWCMLPRRFFCSCRTMPKIRVRPQAVGFDRMVAVVRSQNEFGIEVPRRK
jgi:hypothetical protein